MTRKQIRKRLEYLRQQLNGECISYDEIVELQSLAPYIDPGDVQLLEAAGIPEGQEPPTPVDVRFVMFQGEVTAVFMGYNSGLRIDHRGQKVRTCYAHSGQHAECYDGMQRRKRATPEQYGELLKELTARDYAVTVV